MNPISLHTIVLQDLNMFNGTNLTLNSEVDQDT